MDDTHPRAGDRARSRTIWGLDPGVDYLNHGAFGACPMALLACQQRLRDELERQPTRFFVDMLEDRLDAARTELAEFVGADPENLAFVTNATTGVNTVLRSLRLEPGDELVTTDHGYNACRNALEAVARDAGARVVVASIPFPLRGPEVAVDAILGRITDRTRLVLVDHITSPTGLILPVAQVVGELRNRGVEILVDGAHAPGQIALDLGALGATYYTGNCHKWLCTPKGAGFLYVGSDRRETIRPLVVSHGANADTSVRSRFRLAFDWLGTDDPTPYLCIPEAIRTLGSVLPGGWSELRARNHELALEARRILCATLAIDEPCPDTLLGSMASVPLPEAESGPPRSAVAGNPLRAELLRRHNIEVAILTWPRPPGRLLRVSAQLYNHRRQYVRLAAVLRDLLAGN